MHQRCEIDQGSAFRGGVADPWSSALAPTKRPREAFASRAENTPAGGIATRPHRPYGLVIARRSLSDPDTRSPQLSLEDAQEQPLRIRGAGVRVRDGERATVGALTKAAQSSRTRGQAGQSLAMSVEEAASALGVARSTFYVSVLPDLRVVRIGRRVLIPRRELEWWIEREAAILPRHG